MRRYLSLLPLLLIVVAANFVTPSLPARAQLDCVSHDETLTLNADDDDWVYTSFVSDDDCSYNIEISGQYNYAAGATQLADAFYTAYPACDPDDYGADHCAYWDFLDSSGGWTAGAGWNGWASLGQWVSGEGWNSRGTASGQFTRGDYLDIGRGGGTATPRTLVYAELLASYSPGAGSGGFGLYGSGSGCSGVLVTVPNALAEDQIFTGSGGIFCTGLRIARKASERTHVSAGWPSPRGSANVKSLLIYYNGAEMSGWTAAAQWEASPNLIFESIAGFPSDWHAEPPTRDNSGNYDFPNYLYGTGDTFRFRIDDIEDFNYLNNSGALTVRVYASEGEPPREFVRPLEAVDVDNTYDWSDSNGVPFADGVHCSRVDDALNVITGYTNCAQINRIALDYVGSTVLQAASQPFAPVHAVLGGVVLEARKLLDYECYDVGIWISEALYENPYGCLLEIPNWATPTDKNLFVETTGASIYVIRVKHEDESEMRYLVTNPRVTAGLNIREACVIGQTLPTRLYSNMVRLREMFTGRYINELPDASPPAVWNLFADIIDTGASAPSGVVVMGYLDEAEEETDDIAPPPGYGQIVLEDYSPPSNSCDTSANFADCKTTNPQFFNEGEYWLDINPLVPSLWTNPGVIMEPGAKIVLPNLELDPEVAYGASAQVEQLMENTFGNGRIKITIGQSAYTNSVFGTFMTVKLEEQEHEPTMGVLYDIAIENVGENDLKVHYLCITEGTPQTIKACLMDNYSFDMGLTGWETSGAVVSPGVPGSVELEHGENIYQDVLLYPDPDGPHEYTIEIEATIPRITGGEIRMTWDSIGMAPISVIPLVGFGPETQTYSRTLEVAEFDVQPLIITAYIPDYETEEPLEGAIKIHRVCVLGPYPGQGGGGGEELPQPEGCGEIAFPEGGDVQAVLQWHWWQIDKFNRCKFIPLLNEVYKSIVKGFNALADQFKYWRQVMYSASAWANNSFFPWLAGYMANITPGTIIVEGDGECNDLFCFLSGLVELVVGPIVRLFTDTIMQAVNLFFSVVSGLLTLFITALGQVFGLLLSVLQIFFGLIQQFVEAEPQPLPGLPDCGATPTEGICVVWWIAENTVLAGPGAAIIPLIVAILYIEMALWVVSEVKAIITRTAEAL